MEINQTQILDGIMTEHEIAESYAKLANLGAEGSKAREIAFDFMRLATVANKFRFHDKQDLSDYWASADQFLSQARAVKDTHGFTFERISSGIVWLKDNGFDYTYGRLDISALVLDAKIQLTKRLEADRQAQEQAKQRSEDERKCRKSGKKGGWNDLNQTSGQSHD